MNEMKRWIAERQAKIDDIYFDMLNDWDERCRCMSSTGENMVKESMQDCDTYQDFLNSLYERAEQIYLREVMK